MMATYAATLPSFEGAIPEAFYARLVPAAKRPGNWTIATPKSVYEVGPTTDAIQQDEWLQMTRLRIASVLALKDGWNGPGSTAISRLLAFRAERVLEAAMRSVRDPLPPYVVPCADGSLQLEWRTASTRFEFYFEVDGVMSAWAQNRESGYEVEADGAAATDLLRRWSTRLSGRSAQHDQSPLQTALSAA